MLYPILPIKCCGPSSSLNQAVFLPFFILPFTVSAAKYIYIYIYILHFLTFHIIFHLKFYKFQKQSPKLIYKKAVVLSTFSIITGTHLYWSLFLLKLWAFRSATLLKRDSNAGVFLWISRNFSKHLFWITSANDCFQSFFCLTSYFTIFIFLHFFPR